MVDQKLNNGLFKPESFLILVILLFTLLILNNQHYGNSGISNKSIPDTAERNINQNQAVLNPGIQISIFPENWISSRDDSRLAVIKFESYFDDIRTDIKISLFRKIQQELKRDPVPVFRYHIVISECDEYPHLG